MRGLPLMSLTFIWNEVIVPMILLGFLQILINFILLVTMAHTLVAERGTFFNESRLQTETGKEIRLLFLCSYHAYSRADGAGAEIKRLALKAAKNQAWWNTGADFANGITRSDYHNSIGYFFPKINRSADALPDKKLFVDKNDKGEALFLKNKCDIHFVFNEIGVVFYRDLRTPAHLHTCTHAHSPHNTWVTTYEGAVFTSE